MNCRISSSAICGLLRPAKNAGLAMTARKLCLLGCFILLFPLFSLSDEGEEKRFHSLLQDLRCPVCQNESLESSHAPLAYDLRHTIQEQIKQGKSDPEILDFLTERYGDFIYYQPPLKSSTFLLWFGPLLLLSIGGFSLIFYLKKKQ